MKMPSQFSLGEKKGKYARNKGSIHFVPPLCRKEMMPERTHFGYSATAST